MPVAFGFATLGSSRAHQEPPGIKAAVPYVGFLARGPGTHPPTSWPIRDLLFVSYLQVAARRIATTRARGTADVERPAPAADASAQPPKKKKKAPTPKRPAAEPSRASKRKRKERDIYQGDD